MIIPFLVRILRILPVTMFNTTRMMILTVAKVVVAILLVIVVKLWRAPMVY